MKRYLFLLIVLLSLVFTARGEDWNVTEKPLTGYDDTTFPGMVFISSESALAYVAHLVNSGENSFDHTLLAISSDLNLDGKTWIPIGTADHPFKGSFNGGNKTISGMNVNVSTTGSDAVAGLFGYVNADFAYGDSQTFKNVTLSGSVSATSDGGNAYAASLIGKTTFTGAEYTNFNIYNITSSVEVSATVSANSSSDKVAAAAGIAGSLYDEKTVNTGASNITGHVITGSITAESKGAATSYAAGVIASVDSPECTLQLFLDNNKVNTDIYSHSTTGDAYASGVIIDLISDKTIYAQNISVAYNNVEGSIVAKSDKGTSYASGLVWSADVDKVSNRGLMGNSLGDIIIEGDYTATFIGDNNGLNGDQASGVGTIERIGNLIVLDGVNPIQYKYNVKGEDGKTTTKTEEVTDGYAENGIIYSGGVLTLSEAKDFTLKGTNAAVKVVANNNGYLYIHYLGATVDELTLGANAKLIQSNDGQNSSYVTITAVLLQIYSQLTINDGASLGARNIIMKAADGVTPATVKYVRKPSVFADGTGKGWETICLPFDAQMSYNGVDKNYFKNEDDDADYWLLQYSGADTSVDGTVTFGYPSDGAKLAKGTPYIIAVPNNAKYGKYGMEDYDLVFTGSGDIALGSDYSNEQNGCTANFAYNQKSLTSTAYVLNSANEIVKGGSGDGDSFVAVASADVKAFRLYFNVAEGGSGALRIANKGQISTSFEKRLADKSSVTVVRDGDVLRVSGVKSAMVDVYDMQGAKLRSVAASEGECVIEGLSKGLYLVGGVKVLF